MIYTEFLDDLFWPTALLSLPASSMLSFDMRRYLLIYGRTFPLFLLMAG